MEPTQKNGSMSLKKFTTPVCGQHRLVSMLAPSGKRALVTYKEE